LGYRAAGISESVSYFFHRAGLVSGEIPLKNPYYEPPTPGGQVLEAGGWGSTALSAGIFVQTCTGDGEGEGEGEGEVSSHLIVTVLGYAP